MDEGLNILWEAKAAEAKAGFQELGANAGIESHGVGHFFDVGADTLAQIGNHVGVADFQSEEGIGCVLDEFRAVDGGDQ